MNKNSIIRNNKKVIILIFMVVCSSIIITKNISQSESIETWAFFNLQAWVKTTEQMDIFNLIKQQLTHIGVSLEFITQGPFQWDQSGLYDLEIYDIPVDEFNDSFPFEFYTENGSRNYASYDVGLDWDDNLNTGRNQWFIENGLAMIANDSQEATNHCWEWQNYMLDKLTLCLPLFTKKNDSDYFQILFFNVRETRPVIGNRNPCPGNTDYSVGLSIRKAISYAINREEIRSVVKGDEYEVIDHPINPFLENWCNPNVVRYCHNLYAARSYMTIAGYDICGDPDNDDSFPDWTDWEVVCSRNEQTIDVSGFTIVITYSTIIAIAFFSSLIYRKKKINLGGCKIDSAK